MDKETRLAMRGEIGGNGSMIINIYSLIVKKGENVFMHWLYKKNVTPFTKKQGRQKKTRKKNRRKKR